MRRTVAGCAPSLLGALDFGFLALAAPAIAADVELESAYGWLFSAGSLAYGAAVMPGGALLGHLAPGRLLAVGLTVAAAGSAALALAGDAALALAGRALFGAGTGMAAAPALVLLAEEDAAGSSDGGFARMGGAIAVGFSAGVLLGAAGAWRLALVGVLAILMTMIATASSAAGRARRSGRGAPGALRLGAATAAAGAFLAALQAARLLLALGALVAAIVVAASGWCAARGWLSASRGILVPCAAGATTTMSGVGGTVLLGQELGRSAAPGDGLVLATFGLATVPAMIVAGALGRRVGPTCTAMVGLAAQACALLLIAQVLDGGPALAALAPAVALFGAGHVVANTGAATAVMRVGGRPTAGLYITLQFLAAGAGPLVVVGGAGQSGTAAGMALAAAIALGGTALVAACCTPIGRGGR
jgi:MFS family permease